MKNFLFVAAFVSAGLSFFLFQNCSTSKFQATGIPGESQNSSTLDSSINNCTGANATTAVCLSNQNASCLFGNQTVNSGQTITAFLNPVPDVQGQCQSGTKQCLNGTFIGSNYQYSSCSNGNSSNKPCLAGVDEVANGQGVIRYANSVSADCESQANRQVRVCNNGTLSGAFNFSSCSASGKKACLLASGIQINDGSKLTTFSSNHATELISCQQLSNERTCNDGVLSGQGEYTSCSAFTPPPEGQACETQTMPLYLTAESQNPFTYGHGSSAASGPEAYHKLIQVQVCKKLSSKNADFSKDGVGYYKYENIRKACDLGFHPIEVRELIHISNKDKAEKFPRTLFRWDGEQFKNNSDLDSQESMRLWTTESYFEGQKKFSAIIWNPNFNLEMHHGITSSVADLALPVLCVQNHIMSINNKTKLELGGCEETVDKDGFTYCTKNSELVADYSKIIVHDGFSPRGDFELLNYVARPYVYGTAINIGYTPEFSAENAICPDGFEFPDNLYHIKNIRSMNSIDSVRGLQLYSADGSKKSVSIYLMKDRSLSYSTSNFYHWGYSYANNSYAERLADRIRSSTQGTLLPGSISQDFSLINVLRFDPFNINNNENHLYEETDLVRASSVARICMRKNPPASALQNAAGCATTLQLGDLNFCNALSKLSLCPSGYRSLSRTDVVNNWNSLFYYDQGSASVAPHPQGFAQFADQIYYNSYSMSTDIPPIGSNGNPDHYGFHKASRFASSEFGYYLDGLSTNLNTYDSTVKNAGLIGKIYPYNGSTASAGMYYFSPRSNNVICIKN